MIERTFGTIFVLGGLLVLVVGVTIGVQQWRGNVLYHPVDGVVESVELREVVIKTKNGQRLEYRPAVGYRYVVGQTTHRSNQFAAHDTSYNRATAEQLTGGYTPGDTVTVYVDPEDPTRAIIHKRWQFTPYGIVFVGWIMFQIGVLLYCAPAARARRPEPGAKGYLLPAARPLRMKRRGARVAIAITLAVGVILSHYFVHARPTTSAWVFGALYLLIAWIVLWVGTRIIRLSRVIDDPTIELQAPTMRAGETQKVRLSLPVSPGQPIELATLTLVCVDVVMTGSGKNRAEQRTDRHAIAHTIAEQTEGKSMPIETSLRFHIPGDLPASTPMSNRDYPRIVWELRAAAALPSRPGYLGIFPVVVEPPVDATDRMVDDPRRLG